MGTGYGATRLTARQHRDQGLARDKTHWVNPHATGFRIQGMGDGGRDPTLGGGGGGGGSPSSRGTRRNGWLRDSGALGQTG